MRWDKLGVVFNVQGRSAWMHSHAYLPTAIVLQDRIRVFLAFRDAAQVGRVGWIDVDLADPTRAYGVSDRPCLDIGRAGAFDDSGTSPVTAIRDGDAIRLYYVGWQLTPRARYLLFTGLAVSHDDGATFIRRQETPVLDRSPQEFLVRCGACVMFDEGVWKAWYAAGSAMIDLPDRSVPSYHLAYVESPDGIAWPGCGATAMTPRGPDEYGFGRPCVLREHGMYHMWYPVRTRSKGYHIGFATSFDGRRWQRRDNEAGLAAAASGWDSEMVSFPSIVTTEHGRFMFYNGNGYGLTGVGVARLVH